MGAILCPALDAILKWADRRPAHVRKVSETRRPKDAPSARPRTAPSDGQSRSYSAPEVASGKSVLAEHIVQFYQLLGGGLKDAGWNTAPLFAKNSGQKASLNRQLFRFTRSDDIPSRSRPQLRLSRTRSSARYRLRLVETNVSARRIFSATDGLDVQRVLRVDRFV